MLYMVPDGGLKSEKQIKNTIFWKSDQFLAPRGGFQDEVFENVKFLGDNWPSQKNTEKAEFIAIFD